MDKKLIIGALVLIALIGGISLLSNGEKVSDLDNSNTDFVTYSNVELGLAFDYKDGANGYVVQESTPSGDPDLVRAIVLIPSADAGKPAPMGGEGPATITVQVFKNTKKQWSRTWADEHTQYSNINLKMGEVSEAVVGGANAIRYMADGLYASENFVVAHGEYVYVFTGMFLDENSSLRKDFSPIVNSVRFIPQSAPAVQGKINIDVVCEGALAYMSFPDGASADLFVKDCKEGKHPEVIEQYKKQMNLGDGAAI